MTLKTIIRIWALTSLLIILAGGYFYNAMIWNAFLADTLRNAKFHNKIVAEHIDTDLEGQQKAVAVFARVPALLKTLQDQGSQDLQQANAFLDHYNQTFGTSVSYLLDQEGNAIASSNRQAADSFIGHNYAFRPYFQAAMQGAPAIYLAYGVTSKVPGLYCSVPVPDTYTGIPQGVLVVKGDVSAWQNKLQGGDANDITTITDPHGVVFLASKTEWAGRSLWEMTPETREELLRTKQFGDAPLSWTGLVRLDETHARDAAGTRFIIHEQELSRYPGWRVVCLENENGLAQQYIAPLLRNVGLVILPVGGLMGILILLLYRRATNELMTRKNAEDTLQTITDTANDAIIMLDSHGLITFWNHAAKTIFGYAQEEALGKELHTFLAPPQYRPAYAEHFPRFAQTGQGSAIGKTVEMHGLTKTGQEIPIELSLAAVKIAEKWHAVGIVRDIMRRRQAEEKLRESEERFRGSFESAAIGMALVDLDGRFLQVNNSLCSMVGYPEAELLALRFQDITHPDDIGPDLAFVQRLLAGEISSYHMDKRYIHKAGHTIWIQLTGSLVRDASGLPLYFVAQIVDITEQRQALEKITHMAHHDALTGIPNRMLLIDRLHQAISRAHRKERCLALLFLDLDGFKEINDTLGHEQGDMLLRNVAGRLRDAVRKSDTVARIGGDEFTVLLEDINEAKDAGSVAAKIVASIAQPFTCYSHACTIGVSVGIAIFPQDGHDANTLISRADDAMYQVKAGGKNNYAYWDKKMGSDPKGPGMKRHRGASRTGEVS